MKVSQKVIFAAFSAWLVCIAAEPSMAGDLGYRFYSHRKTDLTGCFRCLRMKQDGTCDGSSAYDLGDRGLNPGYFGECGDLRGAALAGVTLEKSFAGAVFAKADLRAATLSIGSGFTGASLRGARLNGARFVNSGHRDTALAGISLQGADLCGADMRSFSPVAWSWARLDGAIHDESTLFPQGFDPEARAMVPKRDAACVFVPVDQSAFDAHRFYHSRRALLDGAIRAKGLRVLQNSQVRRGEEAEGFSFGDLHYEKERSRRNGGWFGEPSVICTVRITLRNGRGYASVASHESTVGIDGPDARDAYGKACDEALLRAIEKLDECRY